MFKPHNLLKLGPYFWQKLYCFYWVAHFQNLSQERLLEDKQPRKMAVPLKALEAYTDQALSVMSPSYLGCLIDQIVEQQARDQHALIPIWDYALVLNDQYSVHDFLSEQALGSQKNPQASPCFYLVYFYP